MTRAQVVSPSPLRQLSATQWPSHAGACVCVCIYISYINHPRDAPSCKFHQKYRRLVRQNRQVPSLRLFSSKFSAQGPKRGAEERELNGCRDIGGSAAGCKGSRRHRFLQYVSFLLWSDKIKSHVVGRFACSILAMSSWIRISWDHSFFCARSRPQSPLFQSQEVH